MPTLRVSILLGEILVLLQRAVLGHHRLLTHQPDEPAWLEDLGGVLMTNRTIVLSRRTSPALHRALLVELQHGVERRMLLGRLARLERRTQLLSSAAARALTWRCGVRHSSARVHTVLVLTKPRPARCRLRPLEPLGSVMPTTRSQPCRWASCSRAC